MLKKRGTAIAVLALVLVFGTLFGTHRSLISLRQDTLSAFTSGVDDSGYGIATNLEHRVEYARNLCKIAAGYDAETQVEAVQNSCSALEDAQGAAEKYDANTALTSAVQDLSDALAECFLTDEDESYRKSLTADIESYNMRIEKLSPDYNEAVQTFNNDIMEGFPAGLLGRLTGVDLLEEYA